MPRNQPSTPIGSSLKQGRKSGVSGGSMYCYRCGQIGHVMIWQGKARRLFEIELIIRTHLNLYTTVQYDTGKICGTFDEEGFNISYRIEYF
jgi:hypothetical protein